MAVPPPRFAPQPAIGHDPVVMTILRFAPLATTTTRLCVTASEIWYWPASSPEQTDGTDAVVIHTPAVDTARALYGPKRSNNEIAA